MIDIAIIQKLCKEDKLRWTNHVAKRMIKRMISPDEVIEVLLYGTIIEQYPNDFLQRFVKNWCFYIHCRLRNLCCDYPQCSV